MKFAIIALLGLVTINTEQVNALQIKRNDDVFAGLDESSESDSSSDEELDLG